MHGGGPYPSPKAQLGRRLQGYPPVQRLSGSGMRPNLMYFVCSGSAVVAGIARGGPSIPPWCCRRPCPHRFSSPGASASMRRCPLVQSWRQYKVRRTDGRPNRKGRRLKFADSVEICSNRLPFPSASPLGPRRPVQHVGSVGTSSTTSPASPVTGIGHCAVCFSCPGTCHTLFL